jgi:hypothetical protein
MAIPQVFDPIAMPGQRRFQVIELFRQNAFHQIGGDGLLASLVADVQSERQVQLNLQRGAELGGQEVNFVRGQNGLWRNRALGAGVKQPGLHSAE